MCESPTSSTGHSSWVDSEIHTPFRKELQHKLQGIKGFGARDAIFSTPSLWSMRARVKKRENSMHGMRSPHFIDPFFSAQRLRTELCLGRRNEDCPADSICPADDDERRKRQQVWRGLCFWLKWPRRHRGWVWKQNCHQIKFTFHQWFFGRAIKTRLNHNLIPKTSYYPIIIIG